MNIRTLNPIGNALTESEGTEDALLMIPPWAQWGLEQIMKRDLFRNQPWNVGGKPTRPGSQPDLGSLPENAARSGRILLRELLELAPPTREVRQALPGEQSSESLPGLELPLEYKSPERRAQAAAWRARDEEESLGEQVLRSAFRPFSSRPSEIEAQIARRRQARGISPGGVGAPGGVRDRQREMCCTGRRGFVAACRTGSGRCWSGAPGCSAAADGDDAGGTRGAVGGRAGPTGRVGGRDPRCAGGRAGGAAADRPGARGDPVGAAASGDAPVVLRVRPRPVGLG